MKPDLIDPSATMNVIALTVLVSACLTGIFIACFAAERWRSRRSSPERDSLLPLDLVPIRSTTPSAVKPIHPPSIP
ncbi:MAG: hypothetical protein CFE26_01225 [Verrucomicrobiales bacterium VVV1]|nr:MAG: hypothetical protein CFE26_01225 [Verrucomicrobiales bacterium VVV1]